jgi:hypothetical protein
MRVESKDGAAMMSTRDETRRELKDLAKLAAVMPKERPTIPPPAASAHASSGVSPSRITVPPAIASVPAPPPLPPRSRSGPSSPPAFRSASLGPPVLIPGARAKGSAWLGLRAVAAGATLAGAMVGGLLLGQALASHPATASVAPPATTAIAGVPQISALPVPAATATVTATATTVVAAIATEVPAEAPPALVIADTSAPTVMVRAPRPVHHAEPRPIPKPLVATAPASIVPATKTLPATKATPSRLPAHDSLDDLIRKAAASN